MRENGSAAHSVSLCILQESQLVDGRCVCVRSCLCVRACVRVVHAARISVCVRDSQRERVLLPVNSLSHSPFIENKSTGVNILTVASCLKPSV